MTFGQRLKCLREEKGFSQKILAEKMNTTIELICDWESDSINISSTSVDKLSKILGVSVNELLTGYKNPKIITAKISKSEQDARCAIKFRNSLSIAIGLAVLISGISITVIESLMCILHNEDIIYVISSSICYVLSDLIYVVAYIGYIRSLNRKAKKYSNIVYSINGQIAFHNKYLSIEIGKSEPQEINYSDLKKVIECDKYIYIVLLNGCEYYINKADADEDIENISYLLKGARMYKNKSVLSTRVNEISSKRLNMMKKFSEMLLVFSITSLAAGVVLASFNNVLFIISAIIPLSALIYGVYLKSKKFKDNKLVVVSSIALVLSVVGSIMYMTVWNKMNFTTAIESFNKYDSKYEQEEFKIKECSLPDVNGVTDYAQIISTESEYTIHLYGFDDAYSAKMFYTFEVPEVSSTGSYWMSESKFINSRKSTIRTKDEFLYVFAENTVCAYVKTDIKNQYDVMKIIETVGLS